MTRLIAAALALATLAPLRAQEAMHVDFAAIPEGWTVDGARPEDGALFVGPGADVRFPAPAFITEGFDITIVIRHREALSDLRFEELVYLYHDTEDLKNRICLKKRIGTSEILFALSDSGPGKGAEFAGNWYAMVSGQLDWAAGSEHTLRIVADRAAGRAALWIDGVEVAAAEGTQFPEAAGTICLGSWSGRSPARAEFTALTIAPAGER